MGMGSLEAVLRWVDENWVGAYLFHFLLQDSTQKWMILAYFRLIPQTLNSICNFYEQIWVDGWLFILWFYNFKYDELVLERIW